MSHGAPVLTLSDDETCSASGAGADWVVTNLQITDQTPGQSGTKFPPGDVHLLAITVKLVDGSGGSATGCEGVTLTVEVPVLVEQAANPHSASDTP
jgi:hypothetical protein